MMRIFEGGGMAATKPAPKRLERPLDVPEDDWSEAVRREAAVRPLATADIKSRPVLDAAAADLGISTSQLYRLIAQYRQHPVTGSLVITKPGPRKGTRLLPGDVEQRIEDAIDRIFKTRECPSVEKLRREIRADCRAAGLTPPSRKAIQARLSARSLIGG
jgi:putative transposase